MTPEQIKQEQERVLKPLEKYETLLAEYEREDEAYWLQDNVLSKPYPRRLEAKRRQLERLREELNDSLTPTLARQYAALLDAHAEALERERWIPVSERLPEVGQAVLVYWKAAGGWLISCARHTSTKGAWLVEEVAYSPTTRDVSHWRPLPAPPAPAQAGEG